MIFLAILATTSAYPPGWFGFPHQHLHMPPMGAHPKFNDDQMKCFEAVHNPGLWSCRQDVITYIKSQNKLSLSSNCCTTLKNVADSCKLDQDPNVTKLCSGSSAPTPN